MFQWAVFLVAAQLFLGACARGYVVTSRACGPPQHVFITEKTDKGELLTTLPYPTAIGAPHWSPLRVLKRIYHVFGYDTFIIGLRPGDSVQQNRSTDIVTLYSSSWYAYRVGDTLDFFVEFSGSDGFCFYLITAVFRAPPRLPGTDKQIFVNTSINEYVQLARFDVELSQPATDLTSATVCGGISNTGVNHGASFFHVTYSSCTKQLSLWTNPFQLSVSGAFPHSLEEAAELTVCVMDNSEGRSFNGIASHHNATSRIMIKYGNYSTEMDPCGTYPCLNGGWCSASNDTSFHCTCPPLYTGDRCELMQDNECLTGAHNCDDGRAMCTKEYVGFTCTCLPGWTGNGSVCSDIDECLSNPCLVPGATCINEQDSYDCLCPVSQHGGKQCKHLCAPVEHVYVADNAPEGTLVASLPEPYPEEPGLPRDQHVYFETPSSFGLENSTSTLENGSFNIATLHDKPSWDLITHVHVFNNKFTRDCFYSLRILPRHGPYLVGSSEVVSVNTATAGHFSRIAEYEVALSLPATDLTIFYVCEWSDPSLYRDFFLVYSSLPKRLGLHTTRPHFFSSRFTSSQLTITICLEDNSRDLDYNGTTSFDNAASRIPITIQLVNERAVDITTAGSLPQQHRSRTIAIVVVSSIIGAVLCAVCGVAIVSAVMRYRRRLRQKVTCLSKRERDSSTVAFAGEEYGGLVNETASGDTHDTRV